jgi:hypothetical protein
LENGAEVYGGKPGGQNMASDVYLLVGRLLALPPLKFRSVGQIISPNCYREKHVTSRQEIAYFGPFLGIAFVKKQVILKCYIIAEDRHNYC